MFCALVFGKESKLQIKKNGRFLFEDICYGKKGKQVKVCFLPVTRLRMFYSLGH